MARLTQSAKSAIYIVRKILPNLRFYVEQYGGKFVFSGISNIFPPRMRVFLAMPVFEPPEIQLGAFLFNLCIKSLFADSIFNLSKLFIIFIIFPKINF